MLFSSPFIFCLGGFVEVTGASCGPPTVQLSAVTPDAAVRFSAPSLDGNRHPTRVRVMSDIPLAVDRGDLAALVLLDLSAAFDTVDHDILLRELQTSFGIDGVALDWFRSYLFGRPAWSCAAIDRLSDVLCTRQSSATPAMPKLVCNRRTDPCGTQPQGSVRGPILFIVYTADLVSLVERYELSPHL